MDRIRDAKQLVDGGEAEVHVDERPDGLKARLELGGGLSVTREEHEVMVAFVETYNDFLADLYEASDGGERELDDGELAELVAEHDDGSQAFSAEYLASFTAFYPRDRDDFNTLLMDS